MENGDWEGGGVVNLHVGDPYRVTKTRDQEQACTFFIDQNSGPLYVHHHDMGFSAGLSFCLRGKVSLNTAVSFPHHNTSSQPIERISRS